jgi:hypothetical protein
MNKKAITIQTPGAISNLPGTNVRSRIKSRSNSAIPANTLKENGVSIPPYKPKNGYYKTKMGSEF